MDDSNGLKLHIGSGQVGFSGRVNRAALLRDGIFRLPTPNLDWVWITHTSSR